MPRGTAWRLLLSGSGSGGWNMAVDTAVLEARAAGAVPPTLRLYRFTPACVTLGRFQSESDVDASWCSRRGIDVARRPTGGRGVLHDDELTYSIVAAVSDDIPRGVAASYRFLCAGLVDAFERLGVPVKLGSRDRGDSTSRACYLHSTRADLSFGTAKLCGSAQVWRGETVLQHGSVVLSRSLADERAAFRLDEGSARRLAASTATLEDLLPSRPPDQVVEDALISGFTASLQADFEQTGLTANENARASELLSEFEVVVSARSLDHQGPAQV